MILGILATLFSYYSVCILTGLHLLTYGSKRISDNINLPLGSFLAFANMRNTFITFIF